MTNPDFSQIVLERRDLRRLKKLRKQDIPGKFNGSLVQHGFATEVREMPGPGRIPVPTGIITIADAGREYLRYRAQDRFRFFWPQLLSVIAIIISIVALIRSW